MRRRLSNAILLASALAIVFVVTPRAQGKFVEAAVKLPQSVNEAGQHNPPCYDTDIPSTKASDVVLKAGAALIDAYVGQPVAGPFLAKLPRGNREWFEDRIGIPKIGLSTCATLCVIYPAGVQATSLEACISESGHDAGRCYRSPSDYDGGGQPHYYARVENFTTYKTEKAQVFCATGKNWSHNQDRPFYVRARY